MAATFRQRARGIGIAAIATPVASPRANAVIERCSGTLRRACPDHLISLDEQHLRSVLAEFVGYDNLDRPHRTLRLETPVPVWRPVEGLVRSGPVLGGLHHVYERAAGPLAEFRAPTVLDMQPQLPTVRQAPPGHRAGVSSHLPRPN